MDRQESSVAEGSFKSVGDLNIVFRSWRPSGTPRGVVVVVPGFNSHSGGADSPWHRRQGHQAEREPGLLRRGWSTDKALKLYDGAFHDLLNDTDKETVMADITRWVDERL